MPDTPANAEEFGYFYLLGSLGCPFMEIFHLESAVDDFGIVNHTHIFENDVIDLTGQSLAFLRRVGLVQIALIEAPTLLQASGLDVIDLSALFDHVLEDSEPYLRGDLAPATYRLNGEPALGATAEYRGVAFLFPELGPRFRFDFACWRLPSAPSTTAWPEVIGPDRQTQDMCFTSLTQHEAATPPPSSGWTAPTQQ